MSLSAEEEEDFSKLPLDEKLVHKSWKARMNGYQQLQKQFQSPFPLPNEYAKYWSHPNLFHKYILDPNVVAQENALFALHSMFLKQIPDIQSLNDFPIHIYLDEWLEPLVTKALNSPRNKSKDLTITCVLLLCSLDQSVYNIVSQIIELLPSVKIPKLIASIISCINTILTTFQLINVEGSILIELLNKIFAPLPKLASHADKNVRANTMTLILTLFCLLGKDKTLLQETLLDKLKPIQQRELEKQFNSPDIKLSDIFKDSENDNKIIVFEWKRRATEEANRANDFQINQNDVDADGDTNMNINIDANTALKVDPFQLLPEEDLLSNLPEEFNSRLKSPKWKDRVEVLDELNTAHLNAIKKLQMNKDYSTVLKSLSDVVAKDVNVQCVTLASEAINSILLKLPNNAIHENYISIVFPSLLERTKEKKPSVIEMITMAIYTVCDIYEPFIPENESLILKELLTKLNDRIPNVKFECSKIFNDLLGKTQKMDKKYMVSNLVDGNKIFEVLKKLINDTQMNIRNVSFMIVAKLINLLGIEYFYDFLDGIEKIKRRKIEEMVNRDEGKVKLNDRSSINTMSTTSRRNIRAHANTVANTNSITNNGSTPNNNNNNRLNKIIPNKRIATSPIVKPSHHHENDSYKPSIEDKSSSPMNISRNTGINTLINRRNPKSIQSSSIITSLSATPHKESGNMKDQKDKEINLLKDRIKFLENENTQYKNKINELERKVNQHINTIMIKDTEIQKLKRQYDVIIEQQQNHITTTKKVEKGNISIPSNRDMNNSPINSVDLPNKVRRLQIDPLKRYTNTSVTATTNSNNNNNHSHNFSNIPNMNAQDVINTTLATEESWQRAALVTQQLKDRINRMKNRR